MLRSPVFWQVVDAIDRISNVTLRANALGIFQANVGLWQILARQGQISPPRSERFLAEGDRSFCVRDIFAGPTFRRGPSLGAGPVAGGGRSDRIFPRAKSSRCWPGPGSRNPAGQQVRQELANRIRSVMDGQRLVSLDTLLALGNGLNELAQGKAGGR